MDFVGRCRGQLKVDIAPIMEVKTLRQRYANKVTSPRNCSVVCNFETEDTTTTSSLVNTTTSSDVSELLRPPPRPPHHRNEETPSAPTTTQKKHYFWEPPSFHEENDATRSMLAHKLSDLERLSHDLKRKLESNSETDQAVIETTPNNNTSEEDLVRLRACLDSQLRLMQTVLVGNSVATAEEDPLKSHHSAVVSKEDLRPRMAPDGCNRIEEDDDDDDDPATYTKT